MDRKDIVDCAYEQGLCETDQHESAHENNALKSRHDSQLKVEQQKLPPADLKQEDGQSPLPSKENPIIIDTKISACLD